jgi:hypothetical protein
MVILVKKEFLQFTRRNMLKRYFIISLFMIVPVFGISKATEELVKSMVPHGEISQKRGHDYSVKTRAGTKVTVEFDRTGIFDEASGLNLGKGDIFEPGNGLMALETVAKSLESKDKATKIMGEWKLEKDSKLGWIYQLTGLREEESLQYFVNARNSKFISSEEGFSP